MIFIVDIDTTIANNAHRVGLLEKTCKICLGPVPPEHRASCPNCGNTTAKITQDSWDKFLMPELVAVDAPVIEAQRVISGLKKVGIQHHYLTGRNESLRDVTEQWLANHFGFDKNSQHLEMRPTSWENVRASDFKEHKFLELRKRLGENERYVFCEDDKHVFTMYSQYGLVLQCPEAWASLNPLGFSRSNEPSRNL